MKVIKGYGAPTVETIGEVNDFYVDLNTNNVYRCTSVRTIGEEWGGVTIYARTLDNTVYTWEAADVSSDILLTEEGIIEALGYTPADDADVTQLKSDFNELEEWINDLETSTNVGTGITEIEVDIEWETGSRYIMRTQDIGNTIATSSSIAWYSKALIPVKATEKFKSTISVDREDTAHIGFLDSDMKLLSFIDDSKGSNSYKTFEYEIPNGASYIALNSNTTNETTVTYKIEEVTTSGNLYYSYSKEHLEDRPVSEFYLAPLINGYAIKTQIKSNEYVLTNENTYSHAPCIRVVGEKAYVLSIEDSIEQKEAGMYTHPNLAVFPVNAPSSKVDYSVGITGDSVGNDKLYNAGSCVGLEKDDDGNLHCIWYSRLQSKQNTTQEFHRKFNIDTNTFDEIEKCTFDYKGTRYDFTGENLVSTIGTDYKHFKLSPLMEMAMEAFNKYTDGYWYVWFCTNIECNGILFRTNDFVHYEFVSVPPIKTSARCEIMSAIFGNDMFVAMRRKTEDRQLLIMKYNMISKTYTDKVVITDCVSRPSFIELGNNLYLCHSTHNRSSMSMYKMNGLSSLPNLQPNYNISNISCFYNSFAFHNNVVYMAYAKARSPYQSVAFSKFTMGNRISSDTLEQKLYELLTSN